MPNRESLISESGIANHRIANRRMRDSHERIVRRGEVTSDPGRDSASPQRPIENRAAGGAIRGGIVSTLSSGQAFRSDD